MVTDSGDDAVGRPQVLEDTGCLFDVLRSRCDHISREQNEVWLQRVYLLNKIVQLPFRCPGIALDIGDLCNLHTIKGRILSRQFYCVFSDSYEPCIGKDRDE